MNRKFEVGLYNIRSEEKSAICCSATGIYDAMKKGCKYILDEKLKDTYIFRIEELSGDV